MTCLMINISADPITAKFFSTPEATEAAANQCDGFAILRTEDFAELTGFQLVQTYNALVRDLTDAGQEAPASVNKFSNKETGVRRVSELAQLAYGHLGHNGEPKAPKVAKAPKATATRQRGINLAPKERAVACREGTKQALLVDLLSSITGASMAVLRRLLSQGGTPWQDVTIRSGLNWDMNKLKGYGIRTEFRSGYQLWLAGDFDTQTTFAATFDVGSQHPDDLSDAQHEALKAEMAQKGYDPAADQHAVYHLVLPAGLTAPLPHTPRKG